jgi:hypothetical protein
VGKVTSLSSRLVLYWYTMGARIHLLAMDPVLTDVLFMVIPTLLVR